MKFSTFSLIVGNSTKSFVYDISCFDVAQWLRYHTKFQQVKPVQAPPKSKVRSLNIICLKL